MLDFAQAVGAMGRRDFLRAAAILGAAVTTGPAWGDDTIKLNLPGGPDDRELTTAFPQKAKMILQRTRPPLLETPFEVFDKGILTPNEQFFVRWHWAVIPEEVDVATFRLAVRRARQHPPLAVYGGFVGTAPRRDRGCQPMLR